MVLDEFLNAYVMTMPTMLIILGIGIVMAASAGALNAIKPAGMVDIDDFDDPDAQQKARQQLHERRFILVGGVVLILTGLIGIIALQLTTLQELIGTELAFTLLYAAILISGAILGTFYVVMRR